MFPLVAKRSLIGAVSRGDSTYHTLTIYSFSQVLLENVSRYRYYKMEFWNIGNCNNIINQIIFNRISIFILHLSDI